MRAVEVDGLHTFRRGWYYDLVYDRLLPCHLENERLQAFCKLAGTFRE